MNKLVACLCIAFTLANFGCASMRRHPAVYGIVAGVAIGGTVAILTHHSCPKVVNGYPYDGTPPCPDPKTYDPDRKKN